MLLPSASSHPKIQTSSLQNRRNDKISQQCSVNQPDVFQPQNQPALRYSGTNERATNSLFRNISQDNINGVMQALDIGADLNDRCDDFTPLTFAIRNGSLKTIKFLDKLGMALDGRDENSNAGRTPLQTAFGWRQPEAAKLLLTLGAAKGNTNLIKKFHEELEDHKQFHHNSMQLSMNDSDIDGWTAMTRAAASGQLEAVQLLKDLGADINAPDKNGYTPMTIAAENGQTETLKLLHSMEANLHASDANGFTPLYLAMQQQHTKTAKYIKEITGNPIEINPKSDSEMLKYRLQHDLAMQTRHNEDSLESTSQKLKNQGDQHDSAVGRVIELDGINFYLPSDSSSEEVHMNLMALNSPKGLTNALKHGADINQVNSEQETSLLRAARRGDMKVAGLLLNHGANVDQPDKDGNTPLHQAVQFGNLEIVRLLLQHGADLKIKNKQGLTPLMVAAISGQANVLKLMHQQGANFKQLEELGWKPMHVAAKMGDLNALKSLIKPGSDINTLTSDGKTPLYLAAEGGHDAIVAFLAAEGGDITRRANDQTLPSYAAATNGHLELAWKLHAPDERWWRKEANPEHRKNSNTASAIDYFITYQAALKHTARFEPRTLIESKLREKHRALDYLYKDYVSKVVNEARLKSLYEAIDKNYKGDTYNKIRKGLKKEADAKHLDPTSKKESDTDTFKIVFSPSGDEQPQVVNAKSNKGINTEKVDRNMAPNVQQSLNGDRKKIPLGELFGSSLNEITIRQKENANTCYLLSALDGLLHSAKAKQLLKQIEFYKIKDGYEVKFPGQPTAIPVSEAELHGSNVVDSCKGIQLIEQAYLKIPGATTGFDEPIEALLRIFGDFLPITMQKHPGVEQYVGSVGYPFEERKAQLQKLIQSYKSASARTSNIDLLTAIRDDYPHYFTVRLGESNSSHITLANPYDSENKKQRIPIDQFLRDYHIEGARFNTHASQTGAHADLPLTLARPNHNRSEAIQNMIRSSATGDISTLKKSLFSSQHIINESDINGYTALTKAANKGQLEVIKLLHWLKADINGISAMGTTPLTMAAISNNLEAIQLLKDLGANFNKPDGLGRTPLQSAKKAGHQQAIQLIKQLIQDKNQPAEPKETERRHDPKQTQALFDLVKKSKGDTTWDPVTDKKIVSAWVRGADFFAKDEQGLRPIDHAQNSVYLKTIESMMNSNHPIPEYENPSTEIKHEIDIPSAPEPLVTSKKTAEKKITNKKQHAELSHSFVPGEFPEEEITPVSNVESAVVAKESATASGKSPNVKDESGSLGLLKWFGRNMNQPTETPPRVKKTLERATKGSKQTAALPQIKEDEPLEPISLKERWLRNLPEEPKDWGNVDNPPSRPPSFISDVNSVTPDSSASVIARMRQKINPESNWDKQSRDSETSSVTSSQDGSRNSHIQKPPVPTVDDSLSSRAGSTLSDDSGSKTSHIQKTRIPIVDDSLSSKASSVLSNESEGKTSYIQKPFVPIVDESLKNHSSIHNKTDSIRSSLSRKSTISSSHDSLLSSSTATTASSAIMPQGKNTAEAIFRVLQEWRPYLVDEEVGALAPHLDKKVAKQVSAWLRENQLPNLSKKDYQRLILQHQQSSLDNSQQQDPEGKLHDFWSKVYQYFSKP